jgi:hypothetical protein
MKTTTTRPGGRLHSIVGLCCALLLTSCDEPKTYWSIRYEPTTDAERQAVAEQVRQIMAATPSTLSGFEQDWDKAIEAATKSAKETLCRPTLWEHPGFGNWTGRWKHLEDPSKPNGVDEGRRTQKIETTTEAL